uniref:Proteasome activator complex subunit 3 n=1 Tax=Sinocyclocheilus grahami TaxID=75366 RepID=A0A672KWZ6_SINGR
HFLILRCWESKLNFKSMELIPSKGADSSLIAFFIDPRTRNWNQIVGGTKVFVMPGGMMKSNGKLVELIEKVKPEIRTLIEKCNTVKMWVQLLIPRIEDGNNFGVSIQVRCHIFQVFISAFAVGRYKRTSSDSSQFAVIVTLHDMILKNIEKIKRPRSSNSDALY